MNLQSIYKNYIRYIFTSVAVIYWYYFGIFTSKTSTKTIANNSITYWSLVTVRCVNVSNNGILQ